MNSKDILFYAAAVTTVIAGIIHFEMGVSSNNQNSQILFVVGGLAQMFWVAPMVRKWGKVWYSVGIGGTAVFVAIWVITRMPDNFITGRGGRVNENGVIVEACQIAFIALAIALLTVEKRKLSSKAS